MAYPNCKKQKESEMTNVIEKSTSVAYSINPKTVLKAMKMTIERYVDEIQPYVTVDEELIQRLKIKLEKLS